jgi:hypothetical protein
MFPMSPVFPVPTPTPPPPPPTPPYSPSEPRSPRPIAFTPPPYGSPPDSPSLLPHYPPAPVPWLHLGARLPSRGSLWVHLGTRLPSLGSITDDEGSTDVEEDEEVLFFFCFLSLLIQGNDLPVPIFTSEAWRKGQIPTALFPKPST